MLRHYDRTTIAPRHPAHRHKLDNFLKRVTGSSIEFTTCNTAYGNNMWQYKTKLQRTYVFLVDLELYRIMLMPNATQTNAIVISIGHSNSAYSLLVVMPKGRVITAETIIKLPSPKMYVAKHITKHSCFAQTLQRVIHTQLFLWYFRRSTMTW